MLSDSFVVGRQQVTKIGDCRGSTPSELAFGEIHRFRITVLEKSDYGFTLFEHCDRTLRDKIEVGRVAPETLQSVKRSLLLVENMDEHLRIIHHEPLAGHRTFGSKRRDLRGVPDTFSNPAANGFQMRFRTAGANDKIVCERRDRPQVEND